jgi:hypothetical protein
MPMPTEACRPLFPHWQSQWHTGRQVHASMGMAPGVGMAPGTTCAALGRAGYFRARLCESGSQAPSLWLLATACWMKFIPSTPSWTLG